MRYASDKYFEEIGDDFDKFMSAYDVEARIRLIDTILNREIRDLRSLEVGCGNGKISAHLASRVVDLTVCDISAKLAESVGRALGKPWLQADACDLRNVTPEYYDLVVSSEVIEHTRSPRQAIAAMSHVVKPGGQILITSPNRLWFPVLGIAQCLRLRRFSGNEHWLWPGQAAAILKSCGFESIQLSGCHLFPWQIPFAKRLLPWFDHYGRRLYPIMINFSLSGIKSTHQRGI